jgi:alpha-glucosidase
LSGITDSASKWWRETTIYQVYPRSFQDSNGDGIGDIPGIISRLDHIADLGFGTIWLSPFYRSPQADFGYDVADYYTVAPEYGTMDDVDALVAAVHRRGMRIVFDMILAHTSAEHRWFRESRTSRDNLRSDWYIWRDGRRSTRSRTRPPTNWKSITGVNGWQYEPLRHQWFYTNFLSFQPDLNYRNLAVKEAMFDAVRFWLDKGVDGFRLDIFHAIYKDDRFRNNPFSFRVGQRVDSNDGANQKKLYTMNRPENFALARELREVVDSRARDRVLLGEVFGEHDVIRQYLTDGPLVPPAATGKPGLHVIFLFESLAFRFCARFFRSLIAKYETLYADPLIPVWVFGNHDQLRWLSRLRGDRRMARCLVLLQFTVRGIPVVYYGEEIGMEDGRFAFRNALDPVARQFAWLPPVVARMLGLYLNRDGCRTPMQWDGTRNAGFTGGEVEPWLPIHRNHAEVNVEEQKDDPGSLLSLYRDALRLRNDLPALRNGTISLWSRGDLPRDVLGYTRSFGAEVNHVLINFGKRRVRCSLPDAGRGDPRILLTTDTATIVTAGTLEIPPFSGVVVE